MDKSKKLKFFLTRRLFYIILKIKTRRIGMIDVKEDVGYKFCKPMLARSFVAGHDEFLFDSSDYVVERKFDGWRLFASKEKCMSRNLKPKKVDFLADLIPEGTILDGELVSINPKHKSNDVAHLIAFEQDKLKYVVFDIIQNNFRDTKRLYWKVRRALIEEIVSKIDSDRIEVSKVVYGNKREFVDSILSAGLEGVVFKKIKSVYIPYSRSEWVKLKWEKEWDVVIVDAEGLPTEWRVRPGEKGVDGKIYPEGVHSEPWLKGHRVLRYGWYDSETGELKVCGQTGYSDLPENLKQYVGKVAKIKGYGIYPTGAIQHPLVVEFRDDKDPKECKFDFKNGKVVK